MKEFIIIETATSVRKYTVSANSKEDAKRKHENTESNCIRQEYLDIEFNVMEEKD